MKVKCTLIRVCLLCAVLLSALPAVVQAQFTFTTNNGAITILGYTGADRNVSIPSTTNGYPVTSIIAYTDEGIFGVYSIVTNVTIPYSVTNIGIGALEGFVVETGAPFGPNFTLRSITVDPNNSVYGSVDGVLLDKIHGTLIQYPMAKTGSNYTIPNSVTNIADAAFFHCVKLASVTIPDSVTNIGTLGTDAILNTAGAFQYCFNLTNVIIGKNVTSIGTYAFANCIKLTSLTIPKSVTSIGIEPFFWCSSLTGFYFPSNAPSSEGLLMDNLGGGSAIVYYLPGTTGWGATFGGRPTAPWLPRALTSDGSFGVLTNQFGFNITWASGKIVVVEACTDLADPVWQPVQTNALTGGSFYFSDPQWTNYPGRFYRLRSP